MRCLVLISQNIQRSGRRKLIVTDEKDTQSNKKSTLLFPGYRATQFLLKINLFNHWELLPPSAYFLKTR